MAQELPRLFDGAMGTLYAQSTGMSSDLVEAANVTNPEAIRSIHGRYLEAGAQCLLTNTFALPLVESEMALPLVPAAVNNAREAMAEAGCTVPLYASLGPADPGHPERMLSLVDAFAACGVNRFLFETQA
ncbi:homocysteine S-methyltransferase family protein, partial [Faecalibaculum rodentium]